MTIIEQESIDKLFKFINIEASKEKIYDESNSESRREWDDLNRCLEDILLYKPCSLCADIIDENGNTPLMLAVKGKNVILVSVLLAHDARVDICCPVLRDGNLYSVDLDYDYDEDPSYALPNPLTFAIRSAIVTQENSTDYTIIIDMIKTILAHVPIEICLLKDGDGNTPMGLAIYYENSRIAELLLVKGVNPNKIIINELPCIIRLINLNKPDMILLLLRFNYNVNIFFRSQASAHHIKLYSIPQSFALKDDDYGYTRYNPLTYALAHSKNKEIIKILLFNTRLNDIDYNFSDSPIWTSIENKQFDYTKMILNIKPYEFDLDRQDQHGNTYLMNVIKYGHIIFSYIPDDKIDNCFEKKQNMEEMYTTSSIIKDPIVVIPRNEKFNLVKSLSNTSSLKTIPIDSRMFNIKFNSELEIIQLFKYFIELGADINIQNYQGNNVLYYSLIHEFYLLTKLLLESKINVNMRNNYGETPLFWALYNQNIPIVKLLLEYGADVHAKDGQGFSTMFYAKKGNVRQEPNQAIIDLLTEYGVVE